MKEEPANARIAQRRYPYTIDNGAGEWLTFSRLDEGGRVTGEARVAPGAGPPMHVHHLQDEAFTVLRGRIGYRVAGGEAVFAGAGETVVFPAGQPHCFWNAGTEELLCAAYIEPAGNSEFFLAAMFASQKANGGQRPALLDVAFLAHRYRSEYALTSIPRVVQWLVFPALVAVGRLLGRHAKYASAPAPLQRAP